MDGRAAVKHCCKSSGIRYIRLMLESGKIAQKGGDLLTTEVDGKIVMMDMASGSYFHLDPVGSDIWRRLENPMTLDDLCSGLLDAYEGDPQTIRADVDALLQQMNEQGLIRIV